jgi:hypothetical protein
MKNRPVFQLAEQFLTVTVNDFLRWLNIFSRVFRWTVIVRKSSHSGMAQLEIVVLVLWAVILIYVLFCFRFLNRISIYIV